MLSPILRRFAHFTFLSCLALCSVARAEVLVNLDATGLSPGPLATWTNTGIISSNFTSAGNVLPQVTTLAGVNGVAFAGNTTGPNGTHYIGPVAPESVTAANSRTIEAWVYNPNAQGEETVFAWGRRGGAPDGSNVSFNHGVDPTFGAVGHWGGPDIGWNGQIQFNKWTYIVYTWDSTSQAITVYKDGQLASTEGAALNTHSNSTTGVPLRFRVARQNNDNGTASDTGVGQINIGIIRVHDVVLDAATIAATFETEMVAFHLPDDDGDGLYNGYELQFPGCLSTNNAADATLDCDSDGLTNIDEFQRGTNPTLADTDGDGVNDGAEVNRMDGGAPAPTNPLRADSDDDNLLDGVETDTGTFVSGTNTGTDPLVPDFDGDGYFDGHEVVRNSNPTVIESVPDLTNPTPLIYLDATALSAGALPVWTNSGALGGVFNASATVPAVITTRPDARGVNFNGTAHFYTGPAAPAFITGTNARTVEAWVFNPAVAGEETIFAWSRRGGPDGSNLSFNHGNNATFGAVGHWGAGPDIGWGAGPAIAGRWTFVAYTYDPASGTATVYRDGIVANSEAVGVLNTHGVDNTPATNRLPFRVASQNEADGNPTIGLRGSMTIARIRVYEVALDAQTITNHFSADAEIFGLADNDGDGILNGYERQWPFLDPENPNDAGMDQDNDGATNLEEYRATTNPTIVDTDGDTINDGPEIHRLDAGSPAPTDPLRADTDLDGLQDNVETDTGTIVSPTDTGSDPRLADTDGDGFVDGQEVAHESDPNIVTSTPDFDFSPPVAMVNLDATALPTGALASWTNSGALGGVFLPATNSIPEVATVAGVRGVSFDGTNHIYTGPVAPVFLATNNSRTIEAWIYNPAIAPEENIFSWGRRGGPDGSNMSFNHGTDAAFGAAGHWGAGPDVAWNGNLSTNLWTFVAYTYDRATATVSVYRDGQLANSEAGIILDTHEINNSPGTNGLPFRVATQNEANGTATAGLRGSMTIARIRVYDEALPATGADSIQAHYQAEVGTFSESGLRLSVTYDRIVGAVTIGWSAAPGASYTIQSSDNLTSWSDRATGLTSGTFTDSAGGGMRFYRVLTE
jgi:hypothetical protein